jgi:hypothetical protein
MAEGALTAAERRRLAPLAAALARARQPGPARLEPVAGPLPRVGRAGLLAGTFNPLTRAHAELAVAGRRAGCAVVVLAMAPVSLAKEGVERAHPVDRLDWVAAWARRRPWAVVAAASSPLLVDMAEALERATGGEVALLVGTDKAAQLVEPHWYEDPAAAIGRLDRAATPSPTCPCGRHPCPPRRGCPSGPPPRPGPPPPAASPSATCCRPRSPAGSSGPAPTTPATPTW